MAVPYTFGTATAAIPLSQLDSNFSTAITLGNTAVYLGNTTTSLGNVTLTNVTISSGNVTVSNVTANAVTSPSATNLLLQSAGTTAVTIDTSQNVGIGTTTNPAGNRFFSVGNGIQLSGGTTAQAGLRIQYASSVATITGINNDNNAYNPIAFYTGASEAMRIDTSGNLLVGTTSSSGRFTLKGSGATAATSSIYVANSTPVYTFVVNDDGAFYTGASPAGAPYNATTATAANLVVSSAGQFLRSTSSLKYKTDVQDATHGLADALKLRAVTYKGKNDGDTIFGGLIAEEVHEAGLTEFVQYAKDGSPDALAYGNMVSLCIKSIQELKSIIDTQASTIQSLTDRITALEKK